MTTTDRALVRELLVRGIHDHPAPRPADPPVRRGGPTPAELRASAAEDRRLAEGADSPAADALRRGAETKECEAARLERSQSLKGLYWLGTQAEMGAP